AERVGEPRRRPLDARRPLRPRWPAIHPRRREHPRPPGFDLLSPRERDVVERALAGAENKVIAYDLGLSHSTVKVLMARAASKMGARTRRELLARLKLRARGDAAAKARS